MILEIFPRGAALPEGLRLQAGERIWGALRRHKDRIGQVTITFAAPDGEGSYGTLCTIEADAIDGSRLSIQETRETPFSALDEAVGSMRLCVARHLGGDRAKPRRQIRFRGRNMDQDMDQGMELVGA